MPNIDKIISDVIDAEGGDKETNRPNDSGGRTKWGISERSNPEAWADGDVTEEEAREIYLRKYLKSPGFDRIPYIRLQHQLVDFGVLSGPEIAIKKLQEILRVDVDGVIGPQTLGALSDENWKEVNDKLVISRVRMLCRIVQRRPKDLENLVGWVNRAFEFSFLG